MCIGGFGSRYQKDVRRLLLRAAVRQSLRRDTGVRSATMENVGPQFLSLRQLHLKVISSDNRRAVLKR